jgi:hypothetical protein
MKGWSWPPAPFSGSQGPVARGVILYAIALAAAAAALQWLEYRYAVRAFWTEIYIPLLALGFVGLGIWVGRNPKLLTARAR